MGKALTVAQSCHTSAYSLCKHRQLLALSSGHYQEYKLAVALSPVATMIK